MQSIFTNTVAKVMAQNQCSIKIQAGELNSIKSGVSQTVGEANFTLEDTNTSGKIIFDNQTNTETEYYTGRRLPIYKSGKTTWHVDEEGILKLGVGRNTYEEENKVTIDSETYNKLLGRIEELENKISSYETLEEKVNKLENKTTMKTITKQVSNVSVRGDSVTVEVLSVEIPEDCYADIYASSDLLKNGSAEYNSISLKKNDSVIGISGKGGVGYTVQDCLSRSAQLKKGDVIRVFVYQSTGFTSTTNATLVINYFPIS